MKKKILTTIISIISFVILIFIITSFLMDAGMKEKSNDNFEYRKLVNIGSFFSEFEKMNVEEFLNKDNLYENYTHNYTIKIPQGYSHNSGIGKYSSAQFYNEDLGFVVAINVGKTRIRKGISRMKNNELIKKLSDEFKKDNSLHEMSEKALTDRSFSSSKLVSYKTTNYNNRLFLKLNFDAKRVSDNVANTVNVTKFFTFHKDLAYQFQFVSYQKESSTKWNSEIQKSMSNVMISKYITRKK